MVTLISSGSDIPDTADPMDDGAQQAGDDQRDRKNRRKAKRSEFFDKLEKRRQRRRMKRLDRKLKRAHAAMTIIIRNAAILFVTLVAILAWATVSSVQAHRVSLGDTPLYTTGFTTSASGLQGKVLAMAENKAHTKAFQLISISSGSSGTSSPLPPRADDYEIHLMQLKGSGSSVTAWEGETPKVRLIKYGSTGYYGIETTSKKPFASQLSAVGIKSKVASSAKQRDKAQDAQADTPYDELLSHTYDAFVINQNLGGAAVPTPPWMEDFDPDRAVYEITTARAVTAAQKKLFAQVQVLKDDLDAIATDHKALLNANADGITVTEAPLPGDIAGDAVKGNDLSTAHMVPGAWTFDWHKYDGRNGWPKDVVPEGSDASSVLSAHKEQAGGSTGGPSAGDDAAAWKLSDGRTVAQLSSGDADNVMSPTVPISDAGKQLSQAITAYRGDKTAYQTTLMQTIVDAQSSYQSMTRAKTHNDKVHVYRGGATKHMQLGDE